MTAISEKWLTNSALWLKILLTGKHAGLMNLRITKECDLMNEPIDLTLVVIPDRNNDSDYATVYTGSHMTGGVRVSLDVANGIILTAKDDDNLDRVARKTHAYKSKVFFAHYELRYGNGYGRLLPDNAQAQIRKRRQARRILRDRTAVMVGVA